MSTTSILSSNYKMTIPKSIRDEQCWKAGQEFVLIPKGSGAMLLPVPTLEELFGIVESANPENYREREDGPV